jgi:hypothetical protein
VDSAIVFTYSRAAPGRESMALQSFADAMSFFGLHAAAGKCDEPLTFMGPSGLNLMIIPGSFEDLSFLVRLDEFREIYTKAVFAVPDLGYQIGSYGEGVQEFMARWARVGGELALM